MNLYHRLTGFVRWSSVYWGRVVLWVFLLAALALWGVLRRGAG